MEKINKNLLQDTTYNDRNFIDYSKQIEEFFKKNDIELTIKKYIQSYSVTRFFATTETKIIKIEKLVDDLGLYINIKNIKMSIDYESGSIVFEIPNKNRQVLYFKETLQDIENPKGLQVAIGKDLNNNTYNIDLCTTPHLLVAGTTGSGKSIFINTILLNLLNNYTSKELNLFLIDPKKVELSIYKNVEQVKAITSNLAGAKQILTNILNEIDKRYKLLENSNTRNIINYNKKVTNKLPYILIVIDELADILLQDKKNKFKDDIKGEMTLENLICRIAQIGRACGVHLIVATQRPSSDIITGLIKANIPSRIAFAVSNKVDSRVILDTSGAEKLTGKGDMLLKMVGDEEIHRLQGAYISDEEIENIINELTPLKYTTVEENSKQEEFEKLHYVLQQQEQHKKTTKKNNNDIKNIIFNILQYTFSLPRNYNNIIDWIFIFVFFWILCTLKYKNIKQKRSKNASFFIVLYILFIFNFKPFYYLLI